jgi:hypothetical protein
MRACSMRGFASGKDRAIKAGNYELSTGSRPMCCCKSWRAARKACAR